jgi:type II secretory pathway pseudopilin PulG
MQQENESNNRRAFTIVELLTVMSIIIILIGLLVPALSQVKRYAKEVKQRAQFHSIDVAMELFETEHGSYPPSDPCDPNGIPYCGAMKLAEAMVGQDLGGFNMDSTFRHDLMNGSGTYLYAIPGVPPSITDAATETNKQARKGPYLELQNANATRLVDIYQNFGVFSSPADMRQRFVLCDEYTRLMATGKKTGTPILYYEANLSGTVNPNEDNQGKYNEHSSGRIYYYEDNDELVKLEVPWSPGTYNPMASNYTPPAGATGAPAGPLQTFYWQINNDDIKLESGRPFRADSYILLSAGFDGLYGTRDDIYNFQKR